MNNEVHVIGAGLAGSEAAFYLAEKGIQVHLHEMRPVKMTPAHETGLCAELVCSNSLKSQNPISAPGMLKKEMRELGSLILNAAQDTQVPAGEALAVDRDLFSAAIHKVIHSHSRIQVHAGEIAEPPVGKDRSALTLIATGPLTSDALSQWIQNVTGDRDMYFYDAIAPIIDAQSIDYSSAFLANRYDKGEEEAYLNCPMTEEEYGAFMAALTAAEKVSPKEFEEEKFFQGCQPIEAIAATGFDTLRHGPMKPMGLTDPNTGKRPYACVQLRTENRAKTAYNMVGFQTKLKYGEQGKVFRLIPALKNAEFMRLGSIHRNTYVCGPRALRADLSLKNQPRVYLAGQITGVEGYLESSACGLLAAHFILQRIKGLPVSPPPLNTAMGSLWNYIVNSDPKRYQPANANFSLFDSIHFDGVEGLKRDDARAKMAEQAGKNFVSWLHARG